MLASNGVLTSALSRAGKHVAPNNVLYTFLCRQLLPKACVDILCLTLAIHIYCVLPEESDKVGTKCCLSTRLSTIFCSRALSFVDISFTVSETRFSAKAIRARSMANAHRLAVPIRKYSGAVRTEFMTTLKLFVSLCRLSESAYAQ